GRKGRVGLFYGCGNSAGGRFCKAPRCRCFEKPMKHPVLIGVVWFLFFLLGVGLSWGRPGSFFVPWGSLFVLGYAFFRLAALESFCLASLAFLFQSAFSASPPLLSAGIFLLYCAVWSVRRKTFSDNLLAKAFAVFLATAGLKVLFPLLTGASPFPKGIFSSGG